jgi:Ankyrin repeats (many copies)
MAVKLNIVKMLGIMFIQHRRKISRIKTKKAKHYYTGHASNQALVFYINLWEEHMVTSKIYMVIYHLTVAIKYNNERTVDMLWHSIHLDPTTRDNHENTALHMACRHDNSPLLELIIARTRDINARNMFHETPLHHACAFKIQNVIKLLKNK